MPPSTPTATAAAVLPQTGFHIRVHLVVAALAALTAVTILAVFLLSRPRENPELARYLAAMEPVVERHNRVMDRWNNFVAVYNATSAHALSAYDDGAAAAFTEAAAIAEEDRKVTEEWASLRPPPSHVKAHGLVLQAMILTSQGMAGIADYFADARTGEGSIEQARYYLTLIDEASGYWSRAKAFEG